MTSIGVCITVIIIVIIVVCYLILLSRVPAPVVPDKIKNIRLENDDKVIMWDPIKGSKEYTVIITQGDKVTSVTTKDNTYQLDDKSVCFATDYKVKYLTLTSDVLTVKAAPIAVPSNVKSS